MNLKIKLTLFVAIIFGIAGIQAQIAVPVTGGNAQGIGGSVCYSIGQVIYITNIGTNGSVAHGVQQPFEISTLTGLDEAKGISLSCLIYPNPTSDVVQLKTDLSKSVNTRSISYQLFDLQGKLLDSKVIEAEVTKINMGNLGAATYFLKVMKGYNEIKSFKIIKD